MSGSALEEITALLGSGGEPDDTLRAVVEALVAGGCAWAGIFFAERGELTLGPEAGSPRPEARIRLPVSFQGTAVAELAADGCADQSLLAQVAKLIAPHCLVGWDTGGIPWDAA